MDGGETFFLPAELGLRSDTQSVLTFNEPVRDQQAGRSLAVAVPALSGTIGGGHALAILL